MRRRRTVRVRLGGFNAVNDPRDRVLVHGAVELRRVRRITGHGGDLRIPAGERIGVLLRRSLRRNGGRHNVCRRRAVVVVSGADLRAVLVYERDRVLPEGLGELRRVRRITGHGYDFRLPGVVEGIGILRRRRLRRRLAFISRHDSNAHIIRLQYVTVPIFPGNSTHFGTEHNFGAKSVRLRRHDVGLRRICGILIAGPDYQFDLNLLVAVFFIEVECTTVECLNACGNIAIRNAAQIRSANQIYLLSCRYARRIQERNRIVAGSLAVCARICAI